jgi:glycosyltransferase involved in cell wall biosynthesis
MRELRLVDALPNFTHVDTRYFTPRSDSSESDRDFLIFHPARLDWTDKDGRYGKANDRLFHAVADLKSRGIRVEVRYLERDVDVDATRRLISELNISDRVTAIGTDLDDAALREQYRNADIVADQFEIGSIGLISMEAMSTGTPVLVYLDTEISKMVYGRDVPALNCENAKEIAEHIATLVGDRMLVQEYGENSREFIEEFHSANASRLRLMNIYSDVLGCSPESLSN